MFKIAICDDSDSIRTKFISMLEHVMEKNNIDGEVIFDTGDPEKFYNYVSKNHVDVILLDIDLKSMISGLDLAKKIREINKSINIIFVSAHLEYVFLSFKVKTFDYLVKPVSSEKLEECIIRLTNYTSSDTINFIKIKSGSLTHLIKKSDIVYVEKANSKSYVYTLNEIIETNNSLDDFKKILPDNFCRCHKSYIVNLSKISRIDSITNDVIFNNSFKCQMGRKYRKSFLDALEENEE